MIEKVKKILKARYVENSLCEEFLNGVAQQICQLFPKSHDNPAGYEPMGVKQVCSKRLEPKPDEQAMNKERMDFLNKVYGEPKPDEGRLLTQDRHHEFELAFMKRRFENKGNNKWLFLDKPILEAQDAETASIIVRDDADRCAGYLKMAREECQARVEKIFKIIDYIKTVENFPLIEGQLESMVILHFDIPDEEAKKIVQALKQGGE